jgi:flagellar hook protein FlgE
MSNALMTAVSGLHVFSEQISLISNNIANSATTAYKSSSVCFADMLNQALSASATETTGSGVTISSILTNWAQGTTTSTESTTDLAINGSGFFIVKDDTGESFYTRDGSFSFDSKNILITASGMDVQGYSIDASGNLSSLGTISISYESSTAVPTSEMSTSLTLNSQLVSGGTFSTTTVVYDSQGNEIPVTITYTKSATTNIWTWEASIDDAYGTLDGTNSGTLTFNTDGTLSNGTDPVFSLTLTNGATTGQAITWDIYNDEGTTNGNLVQYSGDCVLNDTSQDGSPAVSLTDLTIDASGVIVGTYSDGSTKNLYQIALANFTDYSGLKDAGNSLYQATAESGAAIIGTAGIGQFGSISSSSLESSNVDLTTELANLITAQRAYQACSRAFKASDDLMQITVQLSS